MAITFRYVILKLLTICCAFGLMGLCGYDFYLLASADYQVPMDVILPVYYGLFGLILLVAECEPQCMKDDWSFLYMRVPKALFLIFVGLLCFRGLELTEWVMAAVCCGVGSVHCVWVKPKKKKQQAPAAVTSPEAAAEYKKIP